jgi:hypothetical protein
MQSVPDQKIQLEGKVCLTQYIAQETFVFHVRFYELIRDALFSLNSKKQNKNS